MCGIIGYVGNREALPIIIAGLEKLEYRGYDSAGVALHTGKAIEVRRAVGKLSELKRELAQNPCAPASLGIGHTRWATHGRPSEVNAHPHTAGRVSIIHNGIIENYLELKAELVKEGAKFNSETDTEVAAHLLDRYLRDGMSLLEAVRKTAARVRGSFALLAIEKENPDTIVVAKSATPIIIGLGENEMFAASGIPAFLEHTRKIAVLEDGDIAEIRKDGFSVENNGQAVERPIQTVTWDPVTAQKGGYKHFMLKEIHDQVAVVGDTLAGRIDQAAGAVLLPELDQIASTLRQIERIELVACGTAWHACLVTKFYLEKFAKIPCSVDYASEFRYREVNLSKKTLVMAVSQSGETADTLGAIELAAKISPTIAICNVLGSSLERKAHSVIMTHAGPEISVASTKAFSTQIVAGYILALHIAQLRGTMDQKEIASAVRSLVNVPSAIEAALQQAKAVHAIAKRYHNSRNFLFLGRGNCYPIALEGALKLKEISYIHAEGYPAGEIKHGPLALVDENMPVVVILQRSDALFEKTLSNLKEVQARGGKIICVTDAQAQGGVKDACDAIIEVPYVSEDLSPLILNIPLQFLAYEVAVLNGTDVDLPRNLAKSVTVE